MLETLDSRMVETKEVSVHAADQLANFRQELRAGIEQLASERFTAENSFSNLQSHASRLESRLNEAIAVHDDEAGAMEAVR